VDVRVTITERHCEVPKKVLERTERQVASLAKFEQRASHAEVVYTDEKRSRKVEVVISIDGAPTVAAHGEGEEWRKALDQVVDRLRRLLREGRQQRRDHKAPPLSEGVVTE
jgi:ribosomal subunit interface protein